MSIKLRVFGVVLLIGGVYVGIQVHRSLSDTASMAELVAQVSRSTDRPIDPVHWEQRWRSTSFGFLLVAVGGSLAGLTFLAGGRWGWGVFAATLLAHTVWLISERLAQPPHYAFEATWTDTVAFGFAAACCGWVAWRAICPKRSCSLPNG